MYMIWRNYFQENSLYEICSKSEKWLWSWANTYESRSESEEAQWKAAKAENMKKKEYRKKVENSA